MKTAMLFLSLVLALPLPTRAAAPLVQGRFDLSDARNGQRVTQASYPGHLRLVFFGFTRCRGTCPRGLDRLKKTLDLLGPQAAQVAAFFIGIDPGRDTAADLAAYAANFDTRIVPLAGKPQALAAAMKSFRLEAQKVGSGGDYQLEHPAIIYLMDRQGRFLETLSIWDEPKDLAARIQKALSRP
jgi:protein SCO1/2